MMDLEPLWAKVMAETSTPAPGLHGPDHWARVERNGIYLVRRCGGDELVVRLFALFHDCMRVKEGTDQDHGRRGGEYARSIADRLAALTAGQFDTLVAACDGHTDLRHSKEPTIAACWDADRLDIGRAGLTPDPAFLNCWAAKELARAGSLDALEEIELRDMRR